MFPFCFRLCSLFYTDGAPVISGGSRLSSSRQDHRSSERKRPKRGNIYLAAADFFQCRAVIGYLSPVTENQRFFRFGDLLFGCRAGKMVGFIV